MVKENNSITTNLVATLPTTEKNGVEVTIKNVLNGHSNIDKYREALRYIQFFPNIYINDTYNYRRVYSSVEWPLENKKILHHTYFACINYSIPDRLLLGNVLYPIKTDLLSDTHKAYVNNLRSSGIVYKFNIGELSITPNRESIIYTSDTINKIQKKIEEAHNEMMNIVNSNIKKDYNDCIEFYNFISGYYFYYDFIENKLTTYSSTGLSLDLKNILPNISLRGINFNSDYRVFTSIINSQVPNIKAILSNGKFYINTNKLPWHACKMDRFHHKNAPLLIKNGDRLTAVMKEYINEKYRDRAIVTSISKDSIKHVIEDINKTCIPQLSKDKVDMIIDSICDYFNSNCPVIDFNTDTDFLNYKKEYLEIRKEDRKSQKTKEFTLYYYEPEVGYIFKQSKKFIGFRDVIAFIKNIKHGVVLNTVGETDESLIELARERGYYYISGNKEIVTLIRNENLSCVVSNQFLYKNDPTLAKVFTLFKYKKFNIEQLNVLNNILPSSEQEEIKFLIKLIDKFQYRGRIKNIAEINAVEDSYIKYLCDKYNEIYAKLNAAYTHLDLLNGFDSKISKLLLKEYIRKNKLFRMNQVVYKALNNSNIIRLLCRK